MAAADPQATWSGLRILTVGHSTRTQGELVELVRAFGVTLVADIRTVPRSRRNPQFDRDELARALPATGIAYAHLPRLGGLRRPRADSPNTGWRNPGFRGFADHMQTAEFAHGLAELRALAESGTVAIMCAEAVPWRCHRSLVADALTALGAEVVHVTGPAAARPHSMTPFARVDRGQVTYPGSPGPR
jgi:uncharacterized protein (DUF488 family)